MMVAGTFGNGKGGGQGGAILNNNQIGHGRPLPFAAGS